MDNLLFEFNHDLNASGFKLLEGQSLRKGKWKIKIDISFPNHMFHHTYLEFGYRRSKNDSSLIIKIPDGSYPVEWILNFLNDKLRVNGDNDGISFKFNNQRVIMIVNGTYTADFRFSRLKTILEFDEVYEEGIYYSNPRRSSRYYYRLNLRFRNKDNIKFTFQQISFYTNSIILKLLPWKICARLILKMII